MTGEQTHFAAAVVEVTRKLTDAQRRALLWLPADGSETTKPIAQKNAIACRMLFLRTKCASRRWEIDPSDDKAAVLRYCLSTFGQAVRSAILDEKGMANGG